MALARRPWTAWGMFSLCVGMLAASILLSIWAADRPDYNNMAYSIIFMALPVTGILIAHRQPENRIAWILLSVGLIIQVGAVAEPYARYGLVLHPGSLPAAGVVAAIAGSLWVPAIGITGTYLLLLFPDGRLPSRRWRPVAWASGVTMGMLVLLFVFSPGALENTASPNPLGIEALAPPPW